MPLLDFVWTMPVLFGFVLWFWLLERKAPATSSGAATMATS